MENGGPVSDTQPVNPSGPPAANGESKPAGVDATDGGRKQLENQESTQVLLKVECGNEDQTAAEDQSPRYYFGVRFWHPEWMQRAFANAKFFTFILCVNGLVEGALVSGFSSVVLSTVERRFRFNSTAVGALLVSFDVSVLISVIFISYFGDKRHKPRWLGYGLIVQGIGALVFSFPQYIFGNYSPGAEGALTLESCQVGEDFSTSCDSSNYLAYFILLLGNVLIGIGAAPLFTLGLSYIDDITTPRYVPIHIGLFYVAVAVGPALGYGLGGAFLSVYVDPSQDTMLTEASPAWVGAWWICFLLSGILSLVISIPFLMYPRFLSNHAQVLAARKDQHAISYKSKLEHEDTLKNQIKAFPQHMWDLCKSKSFVLVTFALAFLFLTLYGLVAFGPKFIESVFDIPASRASILAGAVAIPAGGLGTIVGALMAFGLKANTKRVAIIPWTASILIVPALFGFFITCPTLPVAGITLLSNSSHINPSDVTISSCNYDCACNSTIYEPVCGADGVTYFSPCRAGCKKTFRNNNTDKPVFTECSCITENLASMSDLSLSELIRNSTATLGKCPQGCNTLGLWLLLVGIVVFLIFLLRIPTLLITMRAVAEEQRSLALGVQSVLWRALGSIPGPIFFGVIFDSSCVYWQDDCGRRGNCWVYNNNEISTRTFFVSTTGVLINLVLMLFCWIFYPPVTCQRSSEQEGEKGKEGGVKNPSYGNGESDAEKSPEGEIHRGVFQNPTFGSSNADSVAKEKTPPTGVETPANEKKECLY